MEDSKGALRLRAWVGDVRALPKGEQPTKIAQRLVHPGTVPLAGKGVLTATPIGPLMQAGEGVQGLTLLQFVQADRSQDVDHNERNAMIGALLTVAADRRCQLLPEGVVGIEGGNHSLFIPVNLQTDDTLIAPMPKWRRVNKEFVEITSRLLTMDEEDAEAIMAAIHMHYSSALLFARDITGAYALAVGGIEALAARFGTTATDWDLWDKSNKWEKFFRKVDLTEEQAAAFRVQLLDDQHIRLTERFTSYFCENIPQEFWSESASTYVWNFDYGTGDSTEGKWYDKGPRSSQFAEDPTALRKAVRAAYKRRSEFVHAGERSAGFTEEMFGVGPGNIRNSLSYAQLRAALRRLIQTELAERGDPAFPDVDRFFAENVRKTP
ncbi:hypothetical protein ACFVQ3_00510 [Oerskovia sp. NPDC057915]|uniref:hypothetical protein n=1 Tax=Oerskovia sp. NPDC057915 TaxID=3346280 RepID=UPI0036DB9413